MEIINNPEERSVKPPSFPNNTSLQAPKPTDLLSSKALMKKKPNEVWDSSSEASSMEETKKA